MKHNGKCTKLWVCATQHMYAYNGYAMCVMLCYAMPFHGHFLWHGMSCHVALCYAFVCMLEQHVAYAQITPPGIHAVQTCMRN